METSLKTAKVVVPPQPDMASSSLDDELSEGEVAPAARSSSSDLFDPMLEFSRQLEDIISTHGSAASLLDQQSAVDAEREKAKEESTVDITVTTETDVSLVLQSLKNLSSPEEKLEDMVRKYTELVALRRCDEKKLCVLQQRLSVLLDEKLQLQAERLGSITARRKLETLCRELQSHYTTLREETLQRCREDEEKRKEMTTHFQQMLTEIQTQIEQHSNRNDKLCRENANLTDKLENLMSQCELREESLEKINKHRDLQHKLTEAKLQQANALLTEAEEKHKREKEYLLREAIDKTKKCFAMKEQELTMKKKLALYAQKFDEFQATLAKSNEIYVCFKKEMDNMSAKMKKVEKESNLWKTRFENCNKALTDMLEERTEKSKEYDLFVLKIQKLEKLCHALQDERKVLYAKIKEVRHTNSMLPLKVFSGSNASENAVSDDDDGKHGLLKPAEVQELEQEDPVLTKDMARLREEQARLQEFAASLLTTPADNDNNDDIDLEEDAMASAFVQFKSKPRAKEELVSVPEQATETDLPLPDKVEESQKPETSEMIPTQPQPEAVEAEVKEVQQVQPEEEIHHQQPSEQEATPGAEKVEISPPTGTLEASSEVQPVAPVEDEKLQEAAEPVQVTEGSNGDASKKQAAKKKKKKGSKSSS